MGRGRCNIRRRDAFPSPACGRGWTIRALEDRPGEGVCKSHAKKHPLPAAARRPSQGIRAFTPLFDGLCWRGEERRTTAMPDLLPPELSARGLVFLLATAFIAAMARGFSGFGAALIFL